jgi:hypothetical protein
MNRYVEAVGLKLRVDVELPTGRVRLFYRECSWPAYQAGRFVIYFS